MPRLACVLLFASVATWHLADDQLPDVLARSAAYVGRLEHDLAVIIADETYDQELVLPKTSSRRHLRSEVLLTWLPGDRRWILVRNVIEADGKPVSDSARRLEDILGNKSIETSQLKALRDEGARFNLGGAYRNFNDPTFALQILDHAFQSRFKFDRAGSEKIAGSEFWKIRFAEQQQPTIIKDRDIDLPSTGLLWIDRATGRVARTRLSISTSASSLSNVTRRPPSAFAETDRETTTATIDVDYANDSKLNLWLPTKMEELYVHDRASGLNHTTETVERIRCVATYTNARRFETSVRIIP